MSDKLLLPEAPASVFQPRLAAWIGLNESILLQHVHYLTGKADFGAVVDGVKWIRMTTEEWAEELPCFDPSTIKRTLHNLEEDGLLHSVTFTGRSKWYRANYELLQSINGPLGRLQNRTEARVRAKAKATENRHKVSVQNEPIDDVSVQNEQLQLFKMNQSSVQNEPLPRPLPRPLSENILPNGNSGETPQQSGLFPPGNNLASRENAEEVPTETLLPDTPETRLLFARFNRNRNAENRGPAKRFATLEQKQKCIKAANRLGHEKFSEALDSGLEAGITKLKGLVDWVAKYGTKNGASNGQGNFRQSKRTSGTGQSRGKDATGLNPANPDDWKKIVESV